MKFYGDGKDSLIVYKVVKNSFVSGKKEWNIIFCEIVDVLDYVYCCGFVYNDLKLNNVVLEKCEDEWLYLVIIDFGKSVLLIKVKNFFVKLMYVRD